MEKKTLVQDAYRKKYKMRTVGEKGMNTVVSIPRVVILREARRKNMDPEEFLKKYTAVAHFNDFLGVYYTFEEMK